MDFFNGAGSAAGFANHLNPLIQFEDGPDSLTREGRIIDRDDANWPRCSGSWHEQWESCGTWTACLKSVCFYRVTVIKVRAIVDGDILFEWRGVWEHVVLRVSVELYRETACLMVSVSECVRG
jgi:hypothetical protein